MSKLKEILQKLKEIGGSNAELSVKKDKVNSEVMPLIKDIIDAKEAFGFVTILYALPEHEKSNQLTDNIFNHSAFRNNVSKRESQYQAENNESITFKEIDFVRLEQNALRRYLGEYGNTQTWQMLIEQGLTKLLALLKQEYPNGKLPEQFFKLCQTIFSLSYERFVASHSVELAQEFAQTFQSSAASAAANVAPTNDPVQPHPR